MHKGPRAKTNRRSTRPTKKRAKDDVITFQARMAGELEDDGMEEVVEDERKETINGEEARTSDKKMRRTIKAKATMTDTKEEKARKRMRYWCRPKAIIRRTERRPLFSW